MQRRIILASDAKVSEIQQSDLYMTVRARFFEATDANLNGVRVTPQFIEEIVANENSYVGLPLSADIKNLLAGNYDILGHMYDEKTGEFHSTQVGTFVHYEVEAEDDNGNEALIADVRIMKRNKKLCKAIAELFAEGRLKFSFEISCGSYSELDDGTLLIDADESNHFEGAAIVSYPACENAVALDLVANRVFNNTRIVGDNNNTETAADVAQKESITMNDENKTVVAETETAEKYVHTTTTIERTTSTYDNSTGEETRVTDVHSESVSGHAAEGINAESENSNNEIAASNEAANTDEVAAAKNTEEDDKNEDEEDEDEVDAAKKKKCGQASEDSSETTAETAEATASVVTKDNEETTTVAAETNEMHEGGNDESDVSIIASVDAMRAMIDTLLASVKSLTEKVEALTSDNAEQTIVVNASANNPFVDEGMKLEKSDTKRWSLLESEVKSTDYSRLL